MARTHNAWLGTRITGNAGVAAAAARADPAAVPQPRLGRRARRALPTAADLMALPGRLASSGREACHVSR